MQRGLAALTVSGVALLVGTTFTACGSSSSQPGGSGDGGASDGAASSGAGSSSGKGGSSGAGSSSGKGGSSGAGSSSGTGSSSGAGSSGSASSSGSGDGGPDGGGPYDPSVYQHHKNGSRDGLYIDPVFTQSAAATTHTTTFVGTVTTTVYSQPLYVQNGPGGVETFLVATEDNHVTTFNATTGAVIWDTDPTTIGPYATQNPPGGTVGPSNIGITGTPFIDIGSRTVFFDAMVTPDSNASYHHTVFALDLDTGKVRTNWPVDVNTAAPGFDSGIQNQRGALQFLNGVLYVPYGGYDGDGGTYYGSVVGFPVSNPQKPTWWHTTAAQGGIWGPGALPTDGTNIYPVTGNTTGANNVWGGGEAVIRLTPGPAFSGKTADYYAPTNWQYLDDNDIDLGGASEVLIDMPGQPHPHLVVAGGKDGYVYLLDRDNLGGIGGELYKAHEADSELKGAPAAYTTAQGTYVAFHVEGGSGLHCPAKQQGGNQVVFKITQSPVTATTAWCSTQGGLASPMVTTTDWKANPIVWNATDSLYGWNGDTGALIVDGTATQMSTAIQGWNTPIAARGRIVVGVNGQIYVFTP